MIQRKNKEVPWQCLTAFFFFIMYQLFKQSYALKLVVCPPHREGVNLRVNCILSIFLFFDANFIYLSLFTASLLN